MKKARELVFCRRVELEPLAFTSDIKGPLDEAEVYLVYSLIIVKMGA